MANFFPQKCLTAKVHHSAEEIQATCTQPMNARGLNLFKIFEILQGFALP
jgi:hypothetical protein